MAEVSINETCSCGASFRCTGSTYRSVAGGGTNGAHRSAEEMAERWRIEHKHHEPMPPTSPAHPGPRAVLRGNPRVRAGRAFRRSREGSQ